MVSVNKHYKLVAVILASLLLMACNSTTEPVAEQTANEVESADLFHQWFAAEFDNHEQHWQDNIDKKKDPDLQVHEHIHHIFAPVETPVLDGEIYFVKQYTDGDPSNVYRQRLYQFLPNSQRRAIQLYQFN
jgi:hypothetical protein